MIGDKHRMDNPLASLLGEDFRVSPAVPEGSYTDYPEHSTFGQGVDDWRWADLEVAV